MSKVCITGITIYPVKSMKGIPLESSEITPEGLMYDRLWMVVRSNGRFVTQRDLPQMALVHTSLDENGLVLSRPGFGSVTVPLQARDGSLIETMVWNDVCETIDQGEKYSSWLTDALESDTPLRLVRMKPSFKRSLSKAALMSDESTTHFADGAPILVANEASLVKLNTELESKSLPAVPMNRFRPNIVVTGLQPFQEHALDTLTTDNYQLKLCFPCVRCIVTTINQDTAEKNPNGQPFKTLQRLNPAPGNKKAPIFGENAILTHGNNKRVAVGDYLNIIFK